METMIVVIVTVKIRTTFNSVIFERKLQKNI